MTEKEGTNPNEPKQEGNIYDRVIKESAEEMIALLIKETLDIKIANPVFLKENFPKTLEREVDFLFEVDSYDDPNYKRVLIHVEFQVKNDPNMLNRMEMYHNLIRAKYNLPIHHMVIYLGKGKSTMQDTLAEPLGFKGFTNVSISQFNTDSFLKSSNPMMVILSLLTGLEDAKTESEIEKVLGTIVARLQVVAPGDLPLSILRLKIMSKLRFKDPLTSNFFEKMNKLLSNFRYDMERDSFYIQGREEGREEGKIESILGLHKKGISTPIISEALNISEKRVQEIIKLGRKR